MDLEPGVVVAERFRLVRPLGQGGMGAVWSAHHTGLDTPCALKFIRDDGTRSSELRARFEREARAAAQLRSPHVVQILDHGVWQGTPYIAMELLEGEDLSRRLRRHRPLAAAEVFAVATQVSRALTRAHAAGLVHRDLKPANIFLARDDDRDIAKVLDFGVVKATASGTSKGTDGDTQTGAILGTPAYMSPEQARGYRDIDHRADLWALAVVVYQCITGKLPFRSDALGDLLVKMLVDPLPVPSEVAAPHGLPAGFDAWWARAANRDIARRFQTAKELAEALGVALEVSSAEAGTGLGFPVPRDSNLPEAAAPKALQTTRPDLVAVAAPPAPLAADSAILVTASPTTTPGPVYTPLARVPDAPRPRRPLVYAAAVGVAGALVGVGVLALTSTVHHAPTEPSSQPASAPSIPMAAVTTAAPTATMVVTPASSPAPSTMAPSVKTAAPVTRPRGAGPAPAPPPAPKPRKDFGI